MTDTDYEAATSAIVKDGVFLSPLVDYITHQSAQNYGEEQGRGWTTHEDNSSVLVLEAGILFLSIRQDPWSVKIRAS